MSCKNARIVVIPSTIEQIEDHAFDHSLIQVIIFEGQYTMWKAMTHDNQDLYVSMNDQIYMFIVQKIPM